MYTLTSVDTFYTEKPQNVDIPPSEAFVFFWRKTYVQHQWVCDR